jgi:hypothetical protein
MHFDSDGNWFWVAGNVVSAAGSGYDAYKSGGDIVKIAKATAKGVLGGKLKYIGKIPLPKVAYGGSFGSVK